MAACDNTERYVLLYFAPIYVDKLIWDLQWPVSVAQHVQTFPVIGHFHEIRPDV